MRKVIVRWRDANGECDEPFVEGERGSFPVGHSDPEAWCRAVVENFNATLRPHESRRDIIGIVTEGVAAAAGSPAVRRRGAAAAPARGAATGRRRPGRDCDRSGYSQRRTLGA